MALELKVEKRERCKVKKHAQSVMDGEAPTKAEDKAQAGQAEVGIDAPKDALATSSSWWPAKTSHKLGTRSLHVRRRPSLVPQQQRASPNQLVASQEPAPVASQGPTRVA